MWLDEAGELMDFLKGTFPYYLIVALPIFIIIAPVNPVYGVHEFSVYRMQHYDLQGSSHGSRSAVVNMEARVVESEMYSRRCVVARLKDLTPGKFYEVINQDAGGFLLLLPQDMASLSKEEKEKIMELEQAMMAEEVAIPIYFAYESSELLQMYQDIRQSVNSDQAGSAAEALLGSISASGYQLVTSGSQAKAMTDIQIASIQGKLSGYGAEEQLPTIALVAYYDSFAVAPELSFGADANGSGVSVLVELARLFSHLYSSGRLQPRFNLLFLVSGGGKLNYQGSKKWLEDQLDGLEGSLLQDAVFALCLDTLVGSSNGGDSSPGQLYMHVSKPPREGSAAAQFLQDLKASGLEVEVVHKKINLAEEILAWEHERYSMRRLPAFTLSALSGPKNARRNSLLDIVEDIDVQKLVHKSRGLSQALVRQLYNVTLDGKEVLGSSLDVEEESLVAWMHYLSRQPRSPQLLSGKQNPLVATLESAFNRYLKEVKVTYLKPDKRDPEFVFYDVTQAVMNAYSVKPAVFDLILTVGILAYLMLVYLFIQNFSGLFVLLVRLTPSHVKSQ